MDTLPALGFGDDVERVAVVHVDDLGVSHAANVGGFAALNSGPATCGSVMVPCPWFAEAAATASADPSLDIGVHLTLTSEYAHYRWGPVLGAESVPSLVDDDGCFPRTFEAVEAADPDEADRELRAQIDRALAAGIDVTHIDTHMGTMFHRHLLDVYLQLARDYRVAVFLARRPTSERVAALEADGWPLFDGFCADSLGFEPGEGEAHNRARIERLGAGLNYLICHAAQGGEELSAITDDAHARDFERTFYGGPSGAVALADAGVATVGMRPLRDLLRDG